MRLKEMKTSEAKVNVFCFCCGFVLAACICVLGYCAFGRFFKGDQKRIDDYARTSETAERIATETERGLGELEEKLFGAGESVKSSITGLGELQAVGGRIEEANRGIESAACRIEEAVYRTLQILEQAEAENEVCHDMGFSFDGGSGGGIHPD